MMQENRRALSVTDGARSVLVGKFARRENAGERMTDQAPSNRRGVPAWLARGLWFGALLILGCAGSGTGGSSTGGSGGDVGASGGSGAGTGGATGSGGVGTGGSATGGQLGSGGNATGGQVGTGGTSIGGTTGAGGSGGKGTGGVAGSSGKGGSVGSGGNSGGSSGAGGHAGSGASQGGTGGSSSASHCGARPGMVFCDDFEADAPGAPPAPWTTTEGTATQVTVDGTNPAGSGSKSIHVQPGSNDYDTFLALHDTAVLPVSSGKLYLRFFIRLAQPMTAAHNTFVRADLFAAQGNGNNLLFSEDNQMIMESIGGDGQSAMSNNAYYSDGNTIGAHFDQGQWACVELLLDHTTPAIDVWVNGTEVPDLHSTAWKIDAYDYLRFGFEKYAGPASDLWYDDIAFGTQPIGCN
jgi:hypothetical protein